WDQTMNSLLVFPSGSVMSPAAPGLIAYTGRSGVPGYPEVAYRSPFAANGVGVVLTDSPFSCQSGLPSGSNQRTRRSPAATISTRVSFRHTNGVDHPYACSSLGSSWRHSSRPFSVLKAAIIQTRGS